jgi:hypothetical protein
MNMGALMWRAEKQLRVYNLQYRDAFGYCWRCALKDAYRNDAAGIVDCLWNSHHHTAEDLT